MRRNSALSAILAGGAIAGAIDITYAIVFSANARRRPDAFPGRFTFVPLVVTTGVLVHMFGIGVPIALATRRATA